MGIAPRDLRTLILKTGYYAPEVARLHGENHEQITRMLRGMGVEQFETAFVCDGEDPRDPKNYDLIVISGSPKMNTDQEPWMVRTQEYVRDPAAEEVPTYGICFGHHLLNTAYGGEVYRIPEGPEKGVVVAELTESGMDHPVTRGMPGKFPVKETHFEAIKTLAPGAVNLASTEHTEVQLVQFGPVTFSSQFHPETSNGALQMILDRGGYHDKPVYDTPEATLIPKNIVDLACRQKEAREA